MSTSVSTTSADRRPDLFTKLDPADSKTLQSPDLPLLPQWIRGFTIGTRGVRDWGKCHVLSLCPLLIFQLGLTWIICRTVSSNLSRSLKVNLLDTCKHDLVNTIAFSNQSDLDHIKAATKVYQDTPEMFKPDRIAEKGEGRAILLHGPPGMGKTYTAECIAEWSGEPTC